MVSRRQGDIAAIA